MTYILALLISTANATIVKNSFWECIAQDARGMQFPSGLRGTLYDAEETAMESCGFNSRRSDTCEIVKCMETTTYTNR